MDLGTDSQEAQKVTRSPSPIPKVTQAKVTLAEERRLLELPMNWAGAPGMQELRDAGNFRDTGASRMQELQGCSFMHHCLLWLGLFF